MSEVVIRAEAISKRYRVGERERYLALRDAITNAFKLRGREKRAPKDFVWAVRDVSFEVKRGEVVGLIGRNGAGKTTLLKLLARITRPTSGSAELHGRIGSLLEVGTGFHPELTGRENIFLSGAILGMSKAEIQRKYDEIVAFAEVERFIDTPLKHYSTGMQMRLAFAVAAHLEPEILLVDEVLAVGDLAFQKKCLGKMKEVSSEGRTILFVSHSLNAVSALCQSAMLLESGMLSYQSENLQDVLHRYASTGTGAHTINLSRHPHRSSRTTILEEISMSDEGRRATHCFSPGANVLILLNVRPSAAIRSPRISIGVTNYRGERVFAIGTHIGGNTIPFVQGHSRLSVSFTIPPLVPGEYSLDIGFYDRMGVPLEEIYGAATIEIVKDDYLFMVEPHGPHTGQIMVRSQWTCVPNEDAESAESISSATLDLDSTLPSHNLE